MCKSVIASFVLLAGLGCSLAAAGQVPDVVIYSLTPFQKATYAYIPADRERVDAVSMRAAAGEFEPGTFSVYARKGLRRVTVSVSDLVCGKDVISVGAVDVRVVKVWTQSGADMWVDKPVDVPELLLYRDDVELKGRRPSAGRERTVLTSIPKGTSKQFWVTVKVPDDAEPGVYEGKIRVASEGNEIASVKLRCEVLPFKLARTGKDFLIYYRGNLDPKSGAEYETREDFEKHLLNIREHGFTGASVFSREEYLPEILKKYGEIGFTSPVPYLGRSKPVAEAEKIAAGAGPLKLIYYGIDEPNTPEKAEACRKLFDEIRQGGGRTVTAIMRKYALRIWDSIDVVNYSLCDPEMDAYIKGLSEGRIRKGPKKEYYYWQIMKERPKTARLMSGFFLWKSKLDGIFPYCYQMFNVADPYDDFTPWVWEGKKWRPHLVTYPSKEGPIDTLQWEAVREGIDDMKYVATLEDNIRRLKLMRSGVAGPRGERIDRIIRENEAALKEIGAKIDPDCLKALERLTERDLAGFREEIIREILKGREELDALK